MIEERSTLRVEFLSSNGGQAPLTWGQRSIWRPLQVLTESSSSFNLRRVIVLDQAVTVDFAASALRRLIERHQSLRAHFFDGEPPQQRVEVSGYYDVETVNVASASVLEVARSAVQRLAGNAFKLEVEWPARIVFVGADGVVQGIGLVLSHVGTDYFALGRLVTDFRGLLGGVGLPPEPLWQPLEQADAEASDAGLRRSERALRHWQKHLSAVPERVFATQQGDGEQVRFQTWALVSPAVIWAAQILAERTRTSSSTVLLTASALLLRAVSRRDKVVLKLIAGNRYSPQEQALVAPNCGNGIFVCAPEGGDVAAAIVSSHRAAAAAYMNASYDPDALIALVEQMERERGARFDLSAYFNDARICKEWPTVPNGRISRDEMSRLLSQSKLELVGSLSQHDMTFYVTVFSSSETVSTVTLLADTRWLSADSCRRSLIAYERLLCEAALRSVEIGEVLAFVESAH
jgi:hypothetical protein